MPPFLFYAFYEWNIAEPRVAVTNVLMDSRECILNRISYCSVVCNL